MLSVPKNQIISVFLGVILLASVASFSPTPVNAAITLDVPFFCHWFLPIRDSSYVNTGSEPNEFFAEDNYNYVMPGISAWGGQFGVPPITGTVTFSYQIEGYDQIPITTRAANPYTATGEFGEGTGETTPFDYGIKVKRPDDRELILATLYCDNDGEQISSTQLLSVKTLTADPEYYSGLTIPDTDNDGILDKDDKCPNTFGTVKNVEFPGCPEWNSHLDACMLLLSKGSLELSLDCIDKIIDLTSTAKYKFRQLAYGDIVQTKDRTMVVKFKDDQIKAGKNSEFKITFDKDGHDVIELLNGMYNFLFSQSEFYVQTPFASLESRGTEFIVDYDSSTKITTVLLLEGTIDATAGGETVTFSDESKFIVDGSGIITTETFSISEWNSLSDEIESEESIISIPDLPEQEIISTTNIKLNAKEFTLPKNRYDQTQVVIKGIIDDYVRGVSVYVTVENPNGEAQEQKVMAADGHYMVTYLIHQDFTLGKYSVSTKYSGQVIDETTFVVSETVAQVSPGTPKDRQIPSWIKNNAKWWAEGKIGETDFLNGIEYMVKEKIIDIPDLPRKASTTAKEGVPSWIKNTASWWGNDLITEDDFASGIKWLVENGIIRIN
ncbi:MAG: FecR domain-containing protein [Thaumarchaeota archaeon]|nr:FecR domain-containing protein [Nitrososphaerota archaeon]